MTEGVGIVEVVSATRSRGREMLTTGFQEAYYLYLN